MTAKAARKLLEVGALLYNENTGLDGEVVNIPGFWREADPPEIVICVVWDDSPITKYIDTKDDTDWEGIRCTSLPSPVEEED